jgi:hypothetical protein
MNLFLTMTDSISSQNIEFPPESLCIFREKQQGRETGLRSMRKRGKWLGVRDAEETGAEELSQILVIKWSNMGRFGACNGLIWGDLGHVMD